MIWLEGWDELSGNLAQNTNLHKLLYGLVLPLATVVITTRLSATKSLKHFDFTHKYKIIGFVQKQVKKYVHHYCGDVHQAEDFMIHVNHIPGLVYLAKIPLYLVILVKLFKATKELVHRKLTDLCSDF